MLLHQKSVQSGHDIIEDWCFLLRDICSCTEDHAHSITQAFTAEDLNAEQVMLVCAH